METPGKTGLRLEPGAGLALRISSFFLKKWVNIVLKIQQLKKKKKKTFQHILRCKISLTEDKVCVLMVYGHFKPVNPFASVRTRSLDKIFS